MRRGDPYKEFAVRRGEYKEFAVRRGGVQKFAVRRGGTKSLRLGGVTRTNSPGRRPFGVLQPLQPTT